jgi:hypothetical protein
VTPPIYVAAGGGGDAIAAWALHMARWPLVRPIIATFAWDRLMIDPIPGPRSSSDFDGLEPYDDHNEAFRPDTKPKPPAGSTLPRLAAAIDAKLLLLDTSRGATGLRAQIRSVARTANADHIELIDVGGDVLAHGDEPTLRSPLADALTLAATEGQEAAVDVRMIGAGVDGELPAATVLAYVQAVGGAATQRLSSEDARRIMPILEWHPSEATALTAAAARGIRGTVEIRDGRHAVELTDDTPVVFSVDHAAAFAHNEAARAVHNSTTLDAAETAVYGFCGRSELDYERRKAAARQQAAHRRGLPPEQLVDAAQRYCDNAAVRGIDFVTFRRIAEELGLGAREASSLRRQLIARTPERYTAPLWSVRPAVAHFATA